MVAANVDTVEIATQAIEAAASVASGIQNLRIIEVSKDYYNLYKSQRDFYYDNFQSNVEAPLINEVYQIPYYVTDYAGRLAVLYNPQYGPFGGKATDIDGWWTRHAEMYGDSKDTRITALDADTARLQSEWVNHFLRFEEHWADLQNDSRWEKRMAIHNLANKVGTAVASSLNGALASYTNHIQDFGNMLATYGNGAAAFVGYRRGLSDVSDDFNQGTEFIGSARDVTLSTSARGAGITYNYGYRDIQAERARGRGTA